MTKHLKKIIRAHKAINNKRELIRHPILSYGLIENGQITLTDMASVTVKMPFNIESPDNFLLHLPTLEKCLKDGFKNIHIEGGWIINIDTGEAEELPAKDWKTSRNGNARFFEFVEQTDFTISEYVENKVNYKDIASVSKAIGKQLSRWALTGIAFYDNGAMVCTDARRLHVIGSVENDTPAILPPAIIKLSKVFKLEGKIYTSKEENHLSVITGNGFNKIILQNIAGRFPDARQVIPKKPGLHKINAQKLLPVLKEIKAKKRELKANVFSVHFKNSLKWNDIPFPFSLPKNLNHIFSFDYLIDAIEATKAEYFFLSDDIYKPVKIAGNGGFAIVTPIHVVS